MNELFEEQRPVLPRTIVAWRNGDRVTITRTFFWVIRRVEGTAFERLMHRLGRKKFRRPILVEHGPGVPFDRRPELITTDSRTELRLPERPDSDFEDDVDDEG